MKIIAICGQKGTGKDLVSSLITEQISKRNIPVKRLQFGDTAKNIVCQVFGLRGDRDYTSFIRSIVTLPNGYERTGKEIAKTIQMKFRQGNTKMFTDGVENSILEYKGFHPDEYPNTVFLITDLRFKDELKWCKANDVTIIKVKRDTGRYDPLVDEGEIDDLFVNAIVDNNGDEHDLKTTIEQNIESWLA